LCGAAPPSGRPCLSTASSSSRISAVKPKPAPKPPKPKKHDAPECQDDSFVLAGPSWPQFEKFFVNIASRPSYLKEPKALDDLRKAHDAWQQPFKTDCKKPKDKDKLKYKDRFGGKTSLQPTLVTRLASDGQNTVGWTSLAGTVCDGATACVVFEYEGGDILEADMAMEVDLTRYGFEDFWTTDDTTWWNAFGGRWAIIDVATHEFGHFAGLDHVWESPELTMFPFVHDGAQTLGLGDMLGLLELY
jgi:hypothetical protein